MALGFVVLRRLRVVPKDRLFRLSGTMCLSEKTDRRQIQQSQMQRIGQVDRVSQRDRLRPTVEHHRCNVSVSLKTLR